MWFHGLSIKYSAKLVIVIYGMINSKIRTGLSLELYNHVRFLILSISISFMEHCNTHVFDDKATIRNEILL